MDSFETRVRLIEELSKLQAPVVFKGCMVLKTLMRDYGVGTRRGTKDLDIDWVDTSMTQEEITETLNKALSRVAFCLRAELFREFKQYQSAGYKVYFGEHEMFRCDVNVSECKHTAVYRTANGVAFTGSAPRNILANKLHATSERVVFRRVKDVYDLYLISHLDVFSISETRQVLEDNGEVLGEFKEFLTGTDMLSHAWSKFKGVENKPDFQVLYDRVTHFIKPFIDGVEDNLVWNGTDWVKP